MAVDGRIRARARLSWMAERAFGLESVAISRVQPEGAQEIEESPPSLPVLRQQPAPPKPSVDLFGRTPAPPTVSNTAQVTPSTSPFTAALLSKPEKRLTLQQLDVEQVKHCTRCRLHSGRTQTVFGEGDIDSQIMFIGEGPGENEDRSGRPFVGRAGELLDRMIAGMGLQREQVYICNIVKCRPPDNRAPMPDETAACTPYLEKQIETIRPKVLVTLGAPAAKYILRNDKLAITRTRGTWHEYRGIKVMPTFHPAYILRQYTPETRRQVWSDLQMVLKELGLPLPARRV